MKRLVFSVFWFIMGTHHAHAQTAAGPPDFIFNTLYGQGGLMAVIIGLITVIIRYLGNKNSALETKCEALNTAHNTLLREIVPLAKDCGDALKLAREAMVATGTFTKEAHEQNTRKIDDLVGRVNNLLAQVQAALAVKTQ